VDERAGKPLLLKYRKDEYGLSGPSPDDVLLIVEVSESSLRYDRKIKLLLEDL